MKLSKISKKLFSLFSKYFIIIIVVLIIIVLGAGYIFVIKDTVQQIKEVGGVDYKIKEDEKIRKEGIRTKLEKLEEDYKTVSQRQIDELDEVLTSHVAIPDLVIKLKKFVEDNGLVLNSIDVIGGTSSGISNVDETQMIVKQLTLSISIQGIDSYSKFKSFLDSMETSMPLLKMNSLVYNPASSSYTLNLITYYLGI